MSDRAVSASSAQRWALVVTAGPTTEGMWIGTGTHCAPERGSRRPRRRGWRRSCGWLEADPSLPHSCLAREDRRYFLHAHSDQGPPQRGVERISPRDLLCAGVVALDTPEIPCALPQSPRPARLADMSGVRETPDGCQEESRRKGLLKAMLLASQAQKLLPPTAGRSGTGGRIHHREVKTMDQVRGSNPLVSTNADRTGVSAIEAFSKPAERAEAHPLLTDWLTTRLPSGTACGGRGIVSGTVIARERTGIPGRSGGAISRRSVQPARDQM